MASLRSVFVNIQLFVRGAKQLSLTEYLYLSKGIHEVSNRMLPVVLEALIGATYKDYGYFEAAQSTKTVIIGEHLAEVMRAELKDSKAYLQEIAYCKSFNHPCHYIVLQYAINNDRKTIFISSVHFDFDEKKRRARGRILETGSGAGCSKAPLQQIGESLVEKKGFYKLTGLHSDEVESPIFYLQDIRAKAGRIRPHYEIGSDDGLGAERISEAEVCVGNQMVGGGKGQRKQNAKKNAARHALIKTGICLG